jgi:hypothetical protein
MVAMGVYVLPNSGQATFEEFLDGVGNCVRRHFLRHVFVLKGFNVHSTERGNPRMGSWTRAPGGKQGLNQYLRGVEEVL